MKLIILAGESESAMKLASNLKTKEDEQVMLQDYLGDEISMQSLMQKVSNYGEILIVSETLFSFANSCLTKLIEALNAQKLTLKQKLNVILCSKGDSSYAEKFLNTAAKALKLNLSGIYEFIIPKNTLTEEFDFNNQIKLIEAKMSDSEQKNQLTCNEVTIYTDGACSGNPGAGGWGAVLISDKKTREMSGFERETTNNKMEITAVIKALSELRKPCKVELYSDSAYVVNGITQGWLETWKANGWKNSDKKPVKNQDLWQELDRLLQIHEVHFHKVKGHSDNELNNKCDELATSQIARHANEE